MGEVGEPPGRELAVGRDDPDQPVLEPLLLLGAHRPADDLEPRVDLDRVAGHRDRVLPALAQQVGDLDRDAGLADGGRPEDGEHAHTCIVSICRADYVAQAIRLPPPNVAMSKGCPGSASAELQTALTK